MAISGATPVEVSMSLPHFRVPTASCGCRYADLPGPLLSAPLCLVLLRPLPGTFDFCGKRLVLLKKGLLLCFRSPLMAPPACP